jgi:hypothetical protein
MKKTIVFITVILFGIITNQAHAATTAPTVAPTKAAAGGVQQKLDEQINQLKDKIASRVSELNLVEKRGMIGTIVEVKGNQITVTDAAGDNRFVDVDEITKFSSANAKGTFGLSDLTKGTKISILGIYNKQSKRLLARFIETQANPIMYSGEISAIDVKNFRLTLVTAEQKEINVDVNSSTKISSYDPTAGIVKYGFSKVAVSDRIAVTGFPDKTNPNLLAASRILDFLSLPKDPKIIIAAPTGVPSVTTAVPLPTASGKKLAPIK